MKESGGSAPAAGSAAGSAERPAAGETAATRGPGASVPAEVAEALHLWVVLARSAATVAKHSERDIAGHGLTPGEFAVLEALYHKGPLLLGEVQRKILASSGGVTYLVDRLEAQGLVERRACPGDRRARFAALTRGGESLMRRIFPAHAAAIEKALSGLTAGERRKAAELLRKLGLAAAASLEDMEGNEA